MEGFVEIRETVCNKGILVSTNTYAKRLGEMKSRSPKSDWYRSLFVYSPEINEHFKKTKSIGNFEGAADAGYLFFDMDSEDLNKAKDDTKKILTRLKKACGLKPEQLLKYIEIYFSGNKGFHVLLKTEQRYTPDQMKSICSHLGTDLSSFDNSIYNTSRIIRIENTLHQKSNLYKVRLDPSEFLSLSIDEIKEIAKTTRTNKKFVNGGKLDFNWLKLNIEKPKPKKAFSSVVVDDDEMRGLKDIDFSKCPKNWPRCIFAMKHGIMVPGRGERHRIFLALARFFMNQGMDAEDTHNQLKAIARKNSKLYPEAEVYTKEIIWNEVVESAFVDSKKHFNRGGWGIDPAKDELFKWYCEAIDKQTKFDCCMHHAKNKKNKLLTANEVYQNYKGFAKDYKKNIIKTGMSFIDTDLEIRKRTVTLVVGSAGSGKTTFALKILENSNAINVHSIFFCMDMDSDSIMEKLIEKHTDFSKNDAREALRKSGSGETLTEKDEDVLAACGEVMTTYYPNTAFDFTGSLSMDQMQETISEYEEQTNKKIGLVLVDYASRITSEYKDDYANQKYNALRSKDVASDTDSAWIILCQTSRNSGDSFIPLRTKRAAKGAGDWEEAAQNVITVWRPFAGMHGRKSEDGEIFEDHYMRVYLAKNRMGSEKEILLDWKPAEGVLEEMNTENLAWYEDNVEPLEKSVMKVRQGKKFGEK